MAHLALAALLAACDPTAPVDANAMTGPNCPDRIQDTLGNEYAFDCDDPFAAFEEGRKPSCSGDETYYFTLHPSDRLLRVCQFEGDPDGGGTVSDFDCRPIACANRADCPGAYSCRNGLCQVPTRPVTGEDALVLCLADIEWVDKCDPASFITDPTIGPRIDALETCLEEEREPCQVPSVCKQP